MSENESIFLCGGVLFFMLMEATFPDGSARDHKNSIKDEHKAPDVMADLIYTFTGSKSYGAEKDTSLYRTCKSEGSVNVPFNDKSFINAYDDAVRYRYKEALGRMCEFSAWHINPAMKEWLVKSLLEVIEYDADIDDTDIMYVVSDGSGVTKKDIRRERSFVLEPFLVGVLHYILKYRNGRNAQGISTLEFYGNQIPRKERVHKGNAGQRITREITVDLYEFAEDENLPEEDITGEETEEINTSAEDTSGFTPEEEEIPEIEDAKESEQDDKKLTVIQQQTNVIQNGENNFNLTNNGVMNFDFGGGRK